MSGRGLLATRRSLQARFAADDPGDDIQELIDRPQFIQRIDRALEVERHMWPDAIPEIEPLPIRSAMVVAASGFSVRGL